LQKRIHFKLLATLDLEIKYKPKVCTLLAAQDSKSLDDFPIVGPHFNVSQPPPLHTGDKTKCPNPVYHKYTARKWIMYLH